MLKLFLQQNIDAIVKWLKKVWFEAKLAARLKMIELENQVESELEREEQAKPKYTEHPINPELQTGESRLLGGAMQLSAPWSTLSQNEKDRRIDLAVSTSSAIETSGDKGSQNETDKS